MLIVTDLSSAFFFTDEWVVLVSALFWEEKWKKIRYSYNVGVQSVKLIGWKKIM